MKINNLLNPQPGSSVKGSTGRAGSAGEKNATAKTSAAPQDSVQLSSLLSSNTEAASSPPIDTARVEAIKQAISEGRFKVNHEAIADGLIATAKGLMMEQGA